MRRIRLSRETALVAVTGVVALTAAVSPAHAQVVKGTHHPHPVRTLEVTAISKPGTPSMGYTITSATVTAGWVRIDFANHDAMGPVPHQAQLFRLLTSEQQFLLDLKTGKSTNKDAVPVGGPNAIQPGGHQTTFQKLPAGHYVVLCFLPDQQGRPHFLDGMIGDFTVAKSTAGNGSAPRTIGTIKAETLHDGTPQQQMTFALPRHFTGHGNYRFVDTAPADAHELLLLRVKKGTTKAQVVDFFKKGGQGLPPFLLGFAGGSGALAPGGSDIVSLNLAKGDYVALCLVPDDKTGMPHAAMGMVVPFTIG